MIHAMRCAAASAVAAVFALAAGCAVNSSLTYKPNPPAAEARKLPVKVAVLPFTDGTENFTKRGSALSDGKYNLAKAGMFKSMDALTPEFWGKAFADDLEASGSFRSARFVFSPPEIRGEDYSVDGTLKKVYLAATLNYANEILVSFRATRVSDGKVVWEKEIDKVWKTPISVNTDCGLAIQCRIDGMHADWNKWIAAVFSEARADLAAALSAPAERGSGNANGNDTGPPAVETTIERILNAR